MKKYFIFLGLLIIISCKEIRLEDKIDFLEDKIYFAEAQPINDSELRKLPAKFFGKYSINDSAFLHIDKNSIANHYFYQVQIHKSKLDSLKDELFIKEGKYFVRSSNELLEHKTIGDSVAFIFKNIDTIFSFSDNQRAKKINGKLVISTRDSIYWQIKILTLNKSSLKIQELYADTDLKILDSLTAIKAQQVGSYSNYLVQPSRREFARLLNIENLGTKYSFERTSN